MAGGMKSFRTGVTVMFQMLERRLNFHTSELGGNYAAMYGTADPQTDSDQESYV